MMPYAPLFQRQRLPPPPPPELVARRVTLRRRNGAAIVAVFVVLLVFLLWPRQERDVSRQNQLITRFRLGTTAGDRPPPNPLPPPPPSAPSPFPPPPTDPPLAPLPARPPDSPSSPPSLPPPAEPPCAPPSAQEAGFLFGGQSCAAVSCSSTEKLFGYGPLPALACQKCRGCSDFAFQEPPSPPPPPLPQKPPPPPLSPCSWFCATFLDVESADEWCHRELWQFQVGFFVHTTPAQCQVSVDGTNHTACVCLNAPPPPVPYSPPPALPPVLPPLQPPPPLAPPRPPPARPPLLPPYRPGSVLTCENECQMHYYVASGAGVTTVTTDLVDDGVCDDGMKGSFSAQCLPGTDCVDCGERWEVPDLPASPPPAS